MAPPGHDRVVVVTGANRAIGHHLAEVLVDDGYRFVGLDVEGEHLGALRDAHPQQVNYHACGVTSDDDVEAAVAGVLDVWDRIDVLVNNAGIATFAPFDDQPPEQARREFEVDYFGYRRTVRAVLPHMRSPGGGIIHNVSSGTAIGGHPGFTGYASTTGPTPTTARGKPFARHGR